MDIDKWNVSEIVFNFLKSEFSISYTNIARKIGCSEQSLSDWRNGKRIPKSYNIEAICEKIPQLLETEQEQRCLCYLKAYFSDAGNRVSVSINQYNTMNSLLEYLYRDFNNELGKDKFYGLINDSSCNSMLREIILKKIQVNEDYTQIFQVEELTTDEKKELQNKGMGWKLDLNHCFILKFKENGKGYTYKILVDFNYNEEEHRDAGDYTNSLNALVDYDVNMILLFTNGNFVDDEINVFMHANIYVEKIELKEILDKSYSKDYIYNSISMDIELEMLANKYTDIILGRLRKYFSVIYKDILFDRQKEITTKLKEKYIFWDAKFATRHHINFQEQRICELIRNKEIPQGGKALAIGYLSFPCILRLTDFYEKIYLLDNSNKAVTLYQDRIKELNSSLSKKIEFITFTSSMFDSISNVKQWYSSMDFILIGTGNGSFIKKLQTYYLICNSWLKKDGILYISFLNREFLYKYVDYATIEQNFEFMPLPDQKRATAFITNNKEKYDLYCETYDCNEIVDIAKKYFEINIMYSYPLASVLIGADKNRLQLILKELDKEYSRHGWTKRTFSNCKGYYIDVVLKKIGKNLIENIELKPENLERIIFNNKEDLKKYYLKTLLLTDKSYQIDASDGKRKIQNIYMVLLPTQKRLPETDNNEICLGDKLFRLLNISEINALGIEYRNINPFLKACDSGIVLNKSYDIEIEEKNKSIFYIGDGSANGGYKIEQSILMDLLMKYGYKSIKFD